MPYTNFRFIAYEVPTATFQPGVANAPVVCNYHPGNECPAVPRLPVPADTPDDARIRLRRLAGVIDEAQRHLAGIGDAPDTLKIFVAPEFYFRPPSGSGASYESNTYPHADFLKIVSALNTMFVSNDFSNWLFVPGTILFNTKDMSEFDRLKPLFRNTMTHVWGGRSNSMYFIEKNLPSGIDGMPLVGVPARDASYGLHHASWDNQREHVATIDGIPVGFEVCLDHLSSPACRVLKTTLSRWQSREGGACPALRLHILSAGGMSIQPGSVAAAVNGHILRNDGLANPGARSTLQQVTAYTTSDPFNLATFPSAPDVLNSTATLSAAIAASSFMDIPENLKLPEKIGFSTFAQRVVFYPVRAL